MVTIAKVMKIKSAIKGHIMGFALQWVGVVYSHVPQSVLTSLLQFISDENYIHYTLVFKCMDIFWKDQGVSSEDNKKANNAKAL